jgi:hypothetical protein
MGTCSCSNPMAISRPTHLEGYPRFTAMTPSATRFSASPAAPTGHRPAPTLGPPEHLGADLSDDDHSQRYRRRPDRPLRDRRGAGPRRPQRRHRRLPVERRGFSGLRSRRGLPGADLRRPGRFRQPPLRHDPRWPRCLLLHLRDADRRRPGGRLDLRRPCGGWLPDLAHAVRRVSRRCLSAGRLGPRRHHAGQLDIQRSGQLRLFGSRAEALRKGQAARSAPRQGALCQETPNEKVK